MLFLIAYMEFLSQRDGMECFEQGLMRVSMTRRITITVIRKEL
jgi:hypothetical protein